MRRRVRRASGGQVVERNLGELIVSAGGQEGLGRLAVPGGQGQPRVTVVRARHRDHPSSGGGAAGGPDRQVHRFASAAGEDRVGHAGCALDEVGGQQRPFDAREVVVADVELVEGVDEDADQLGVAVPEVEHPPVEVQVQPGATVDVGDPVPVAATHDDPGAERVERPYAIGAQVALGHGEDVAASGGVHAVTGAARDREVGATHRRSMAPLGCATPCGTADHPHHHVQDLSSRNQRCEAPAHR